MKLSAHLFLGAHLYYYADGVLPKHEEILLEGTPGASEKRVSFFASSEAENTDRSINDREHISTTRYLAGAAFAVMAGTALSRVFGYVREIAAAAYFGAGAEKSAFDVAFLVPSTFQVLVAQAALSAALIPVFAGLLQKDRRQEAWHVASTIFTLAMIVLGTVVAVFIVFAPQIMPIFAPGYRNDPAMMADIVSMSRLLFPIILLLAVTGIVISILNSYEQFTVPAVAPVFWNLIIILAIVFGADRLGIKALAWGVLLGTIAQLAIQLPWLRGRGGRLGWGLDWRNPYVKQVGILILPVSLSLGLINLNALVDVQFASYLGEGGVAAMNYAFRLYNMPEALFAVAIGTVLFPTLSKLAAKDDIDTFRYTVSAGIRTIFFLLVPISAYIIVLSEPLVRLVYERGEFVSSDTELVASTLLFFAFGTALSGCSGLLTRGFFSLEKPWVPTLIAFLNLGFNALFNWILIKPLDLGGIALSTTAVSTLTFLALFYLLRSRLGRMDGAAIVRTFIMASLLSALAVPVAYLSWYLLDMWLGVSIWAQLLSIGLSFAAAAAVYILLAWAARMPELWMFSSLRRGSPAAAGK